MVFTDVICFNHSDLGAFSLGLRMYLSAVKDEKPIPVLRPLSMISRPVPHFKQIPSREPGLIFSSWDFISVLILGLKSII